MPGHQVLAREQLVRAAPGEDSPSAMTTRRSAKSETTSMSWQTMMTAEPPSAISRTVSITVMHSR